MYTRLSLLSLSVLGAVGLAACSGQQPAPQSAPAPATTTAAAGARVPTRPEETEQWTPVPAIVTPGANGAPPSDAVVLFNGTNLDEWVLMKDKSPATWTLADGAMTVNKAVGGIETKRSFTDYQLHLEWRIPVGITGTGQARGNSGVFLASTGPGDMGYELQVLDSYNNTTYVNGQAASIYKQSPPLVNAMRPPGEWQVYDIIWTAPRFNADGSVKSPAYDHRAAQRRARAEPLRAEGPHAVHRPAAVQGPRRRADQAAVARRSEPADFASGISGFGAFESCELDSGLVGR